MRRARRADRSHVGRADTRAARFWAKVAVVDDENSCWLWIGALFAGSGYGVLDGRGAHRVSFELHNGEIPKGAFICHRCDVHACVRPSHLFAGSPLDNMRDMIAKGRNVEGEAVCTAKLTAEQVLEIRRLHAAGEASSRELAARFGVGRPHISTIVRGLAWKRIEPGRGGRHFILGGEP